MSYPPPLYDGEGEASAWVRRSGEPPALTYGNGGTVDYLATGAATGGLFGGTSPSPTKTNASRARQS